MIIALIPGHTAKNQGASYGDISEYGPASAIIGDLIWRLSKTEHEPVLIGSDSNGTQAKKVNAVNADFGLELHFNSHVGDSMHGTETLHAGSRSGEKLAEYIQGPLFKMLGTRNRGIAVGHYQMNTSKAIDEILRKTNCPFVIPEPLFLSNENDRQKLDIQLISIALFEGIKNYMRSL